MNLIEKLFPILMITILTLLSGFGDSRGFIHAAEIWKNGKLNFREVWLSGLGFGTGILMFWLALKYLRMLNVAVSPEVQTLGWFCVTIIGVALSSGEFLKWNFADRIIGFLIILGLAWLLFRGH